jgi:hypothetical protein
MFTSIIHIDAVKSVAISGFTELTKGCFENKTLLKTKYPVLMTIYLPFLNSPPPPTHPPQKINNIAACTGSHGKYTF